MKSLIVVKAPAKINLFLRVTGKRDDGYHEIASVMAKINLYDTLTIKRTDDSRILLTADSPQIPTDERNIIVKAAKALRQKSDVSTGAKIHLDKKIPVAAGLGGGSSDAASTLIALNKLWGCNLPADELSEIALTLGADVPFFLGGPMAYATGVGEKLTELKCEKPLPLLLINPGFDLLAKEAYENSDFIFEPSLFDDEIKNDIISGSPLQVVKYMENDLQLWAFEKRPKLAKLHKKILDMSEPIKPVKVMMSGSGPTLFALYRNDVEASRAVKSLKDLAPFVRLSATLVE